MLPISVAVITKNEENNIEDALKSVSDVLLNTTCDGFYIPREKYFLGKWIKHSGWWTDNTLRLFKKEKGHLEPRDVHENVVLDCNAGYLIHPLDQYSY